VSAAAQAPETWYGHETAQPAGCPRPGQGPGTLGPEPAWSVWTPLAYLWQDVLVVCSTRMDATLRQRERVSWAIYGLLGFYAAITYPSPVCSRPR